MLAALRRFAVFQAFLLWQGGFLFYSAVVVPIGTDQLGSAREQGFISQRVGWWLNAVGVAWAAVYLVDWLAGGRAAPYRRARLLLWCVEVATLAALIGLHPLLGELLDPDALTILDRPGFRRLHLAYLWLCTAQWLAGLALAWLTLSAWTRPSEPRDTP